MKPAIPPDVEQEFLRIPAAVKFSGLSSSTLERLIKIGVLKSKCIRQPNAIRGIRLISKQVLRDFINSCEDNPEDRPMRAPKKKAIEKPVKGGEPL